MRPEIRVLGIDDGPFEKKSKEVLVVATFFRGSKSMDGLLSTTVRKDGWNATDKLIAMVKGSKFLPQIRAILLDGIALGGFNVVDIGKLHHALKIPVIVIMRHYPEKKTMYWTLRRIGQWRKIVLIENAGEIYPLGKIHFQCAGIIPEKAKEIIHLATTNAYIPECLRIAHIIAGGIIKGESYGRA